MIAGLLLSKAGLRVLVLEQNPDFEREYRGEVLMPRFTQAMRQIGLFSYLEKFPHIKLDGFEGYYRDFPFFRVGFDKISPEVPFAVWMPQPVLLRALHEKGKEIPSFDIWFHARVEKLIKEGEKVVGAVVEKDKKEIEVRAKVVIGADGRFSMVRRSGGFKEEFEHHRIDLVWFTVSQPPGYGNIFRFYISPSRNYLFLPKYPNQLQVGVVVKKGEYAEYRNKGIEFFKKILRETEQPIIIKFAETLKDFTPFNVLQARIERVEKWAKDGVLLIGDSAHTCSPAGAVGVSVAVATAIVAADVVRDCFRKNDFSAAALGRVQEIRGPEVVDIQNRQKRVTAILAPGSRIISQVFAPLALFFISKFGLFRQVQRRLMVAEKPLPVSKDLGFN